MNIINTILTYFLSHCQAAGLNICIPSSSWRLLSSLFRASALSQRQKMTRSLENFFGNCLENYKSLASFLRYIFLPGMNVCHVIHEIFALHHLGGNALFAINTQKYTQIYPAEKKHHQKQLELNKYLPRKMGRK